MAISCSVHEKVYADYILVDDPPRRPWICKNCGELSSSQVGEAGSRQLFATLVEKFHPKNTTAK